MKEKEAVRVTTIIRCFVCCDIDLFVALGMGYYFNSTAAAAVVKLPNENVKPGPPSIESRQLFLLQQHHRPAITLSHFFPSEARKGLKNKKRRQIMIISSRALVSY